ncbi:citrate lyase [Acrocarpospora pleiomorpha]|uniref:Citrate lyase n=1 Tax=Acrocarpospora pleiomorpha TaxID=90975 RepID=A0A5M3XUN5_9ACTN|nr:CoA ester lyase [Acrocarpospora pleiomorpha]GES24610.1 citrate lyase [Acrocarpospora pleiomorpha]
MKPDVVSELANPRRSCLSVPASAPRLIAKALASTADEVIIDLEDAVAVSAKDEARDNVMSTLSGPVTADIHVTVRVNAPRSAWIAADVVALAGLPRLPHSIMVPKVEASDDLAMVGRLVEEHGGAGRPPIELQALVESARGLTSLAEIVRGAPRPEALVIGYADLAADLGRDPIAELWGPAHEHVLWHARSVGIRAVDGPWLGVHDDEVFRASVNRARTAGFDAKWVLHPAQLGFVNAAFAPTVEEIAWATEVVQALEAAGSGVLARDGQMIDEAVALRARRILASLS